VSDAVSRAVDISVSVVALAVAWPVLVIVAVAIRVTMGAPVMFRQQRAGRDGRTFEVVKFRTMRTTRQATTGPTPTNASPAWAACSAPPASTSCPRWPTCCGAT
jgi:lipopolysaccharide/colanic/teichoic acid biosynthesis glycosyltransferase